MSMIGSFRETGCDEDRDTVYDVCCYCAMKDEIKVATHFCFDCGVIGRFLCASCLQNHNLFVGNHDVTLVGRSSNYRKELQLQIAKERKKSKAVETDAANLKIELAQIDQRLKEEEKRRLHERKELQHEIAKEQEKFMAAETDAANLKIKLTQIDQRFTEEEKRRLKETTKLQHDIVKEQERCTTAETVTANLKIELAQTDKRLKEEETRRLNEWTKLQNEIGKEQERSTTAETDAAKLKIELAQTDQRLKKEETMRLNERKYLQNEIVKERNKSMAAEADAVNLRIELAQIDRRLKEEEARRLNESNTALKPKNSSSKGRVKDDIAKERKKSTAAETLAANLKKELTDMKREEMKIQNEGEELKDVIAKEGKKSTSAETLAANLKKELTDMKREEMKIQNEGEELKDVIAKEGKKSTSAETLAAKLQKELTDMKREEMKIQNERDLEQFNIEHYKKDKMLVAAIYFGTTFSGYAFSFKHDYQAEPYKVSVNQRWVAGSMALVSLKSPTVVLFDENKKFHSFGYDAEYTYDDLASDNEHHKWYFFEQITRIFHNKQISQDVEIEDAKGRKMKAIDVFWTVIKFIKDQLLNLFKTRGTEVQNEDIHFVLTALPMWSDSAKQFMREAAYKAGIEGGQLSIVSDHEAASLYVQVLPTDRIHGSKGAKFTVASPGTKFMVVDLGASMAHITVYERQADGGLRELHKVSGGACGGTKVEDEFYGLLIRLIGGPVYQQFVDQNKSDHLDLQRDLKSKLTNTPLSSGKISVKVPVALLKTFEDETKEDIKEAIEGSPYNGKITWRNDILRIEAQVFKNLFKPWTDKIVNHIKELLKAKDVQGTNIFLMVGEFSASTVLQDAIMKAFPKGNVIIPDEPDLTVLKGAVIFGHRHTSF